MLLLAALRRSLATAVLSAAAVGACAATIYSPAAAQANSADGKAAVAVVNRLFDAMRAGDSAGVRATFHPKAQFATAAVKDGQPLVQFESIDPFLRAVGTPHPEVWDERLSNVVVHVDGPLAVVWADYAFYLGDKFSHCGVDAFQLARTGDTWQIVSIIDTRRKQGCPDQKH
ncbi:MAG TPA: nuclear transport factor 2 family protein [Gemmatimonadales bacterium]|nr:nuclear transport factor 2 family protein [Gemmatimonadales bacterium]